MIEPSDKLLSPMTVARVLGVKKRTVYKYLREDKLDGVKLSERNIRIYQSSVEKFAGIKLSREDVK